jgi:hypothetical protein
LFPFTPDPSQIAWAIQHAVPEKSRKGWLKYVNSGAALADIRKQYADAKQVKFLICDCLHQFTTFFSPSKTSSRRQKWKQCVDGHPI